MNIDIRKDVVMNYMYMHYVLKIKDKKIKKIFHSSLIKIAVLLWMSQIYYFCVCSSIAESAHKIWISSAISFVIKMPEHWIS